MSLSFGNDIRSFVMTVERFSIGPKLDTICGMKEGNIMFLSSVKFAYFFRARVRCKGKARTGKGGGWVRGFEERCCKVHNGVK